MVLQVLSVTFPFFALVLLGYLAAKRGMLPVDAIPGLNTFVLYFALPCMLYRFGASTPIAKLLDFKVLFVYLFCALVMVAFTVACTLSRRIDWNNASMGALVGAFPNTGFMGVPLLVALLGNHAAGYAIITIVVDIVITSSLCMALSRMDAAQGRGVWWALRRALRGVLSNPMPWAILLGAAASAIQLQLPDPVGKTLGLLADAASPVALFTIGAVLARAQARADDANSRNSLYDHSLATRATWGSVCQIALFKLLLHPVLVLFVGSAAIRWGVGLSKSALVVMVLVAALPSASNVSLLAERLGADNGRIARIIMVSTVLAFFTFSGAVALLR